MEEKRYQLKVGSGEIEVRVGKYAGLANGSCIVKSGETMVMVNVTMSAKPREGMDFFPLGVDFEEVDVGHESSEVAEFDIITCLDAVAAAHVIVALDDVE